MKFSGLVIMIGQEVKGPRREEETVALAGW